MRVKDIHLAKTLEELNGKAALRNLSREDPKKLMNSAAKILDQAKIADLKDKDEEQEYIYLMKYMELYQTAMKSPKLTTVDREHLKILTGKKAVNDVMLRLEQLSTSLKKRYDLKNEVVRLESEKDEAEKKEAAATMEAKKEKEESKKLKPFMNGVTMNVVDPLEINNDKGDMTISQLKNLMEQKSTPILIIDCRAASDFTSAHVSHNDCISIPSEILVAGISANKITQCLKASRPESYHRWNKRGTFEKIILYDWNSSVCNQSSESIECLLKAMNQWDMDTKYKSKPFILQGGIRNVYYSYPMLINKPLNVKNGGQSEPVEKVRSSVANLSIDTISYPDLDEDEAKSRNLNNHIGNQHEVSRNIILNGDSIAFDSLQTFDRTKKPLTKSKVPHSSTNGLPTPTSALSSTSTTIQNGTNLPDGALPILKNNQPPDTSALTNSTSFLYSGHDKMNGGSSTNIYASPSTSETNNSGHSDSDKVMGNGNGGLTIGEPNNIPTSVASSSTGVKMPNGGEDTSKARSISAGINNTQNNNIVTNGRHINGDSNSVTVIKNDVGLSSPKITRPPIPDTRTKPARVRTNTSPGTDQPQAPLSPDGPGFSVTKLKDDNYDSPRSSLLKRSHSNPNISQLSGEILDEDESSQLLKPQFNRNLKPSSNNRILNGERESYYRRRDFQVVSSTDKSETGLKNLGNTCYMNSIMQCINHTVPLVEYFRSLEYRGELTKKRGPSRGEVTEEVGKSIIEMNKGHRSISLFNLKTAFGKFNKTFGSSEQQDSHEFLTFLLDHMHEELNKRTKQPFKEQKNDGVPDETAADNAWNDYLASNDSIITELFCGQQKSCVRCLNCNNSSTTFDTFFVLSIPIPETRIPGKRYTIQECLDLYTAEEEISDWGCASCKANGRAKKKIDLWRLPPTLIIHFQRFYVDSYCKKRLTEIDFHVEALELTRFMRGRRNYPFVYQLYGTSNHYGTMDSGHYTAYCRRNKSWAKFDDQEVCGILPQNVPTSAAYILFYCQLDTP